MAVLKAKVGATWVAVAGGMNGPPGPGVPVGGIAGQQLTKIDDTDFNTQWTSIPGGMANPLTTTGDMIFSSSGSIPARLGIGTAGQLLTVVSGLPTWQPPSLVNPMTSVGDIIIGGTAGAQTRLALGAESYVLTSFSGSPTWRPTFINPMTAAGDLIIGNPMAGMPMRLAVGSNTEVLTVVAGEPKWAAGSVPAGSKMLFDMDAAPTGWTRDVTAATYNDRVVRIVTGARTHGGSWTISGLTASGVDHLHLVPAHGHSVNAVATSTGSLEGPAGTGANTLSADSHTHTVNAHNTNAQAAFFTGAADRSLASAVTSNAAWRPLQRDFILCVKD